MAAIRAAAASLSDVVDQTVADLNSRAAEVERMRQELEEEKEMMNSLLSCGDGSAEVIEINVGGDIFQTKRGTLLSAEGSLLAAMFSGRWEEALDRDKEGRVFLDFDPAPFRTLLNHLRLRRISEPRKVPQPVAQPEHKDLFGAMVRFLGMEDFLRGPACCDEAALTCVKAGAADTGVTVDGGKVSTTANGACPIVGTSLMHTGAHPCPAWKVSVSQLRGGWVLAGIISNPNPAETSWTDTTSYLWASDHILVRAGEIVEQEGVHLQEGDTIIFLLDTSRNRLRMFLERTGEIQDIVLPDGVATLARLHLYLRGPGTEVQVSPATSGEVARAGL